MKKLTKLEVIRKAIGLAQYYNDEERLAEIAESINYSQYIKLSKAQQEAIDKWIDWEEE